MRFIKAIICAIGLSLATIPSQALDATNCTVGKILLFKMGTTQTVFSDKAVDVPVLSLKAKFPQPTVTNSEISLTLKILSMVKPSATYTYVPGASKTFQGDLAVGATMMIPCAELKVIRTLIEIGPQYTTAVVGGKTEYIGGIGLTMGLAQSSTSMSGFFAFVGAGWDFNRAEIVYSIGFGIALGPTPIPAP